MSGPLTFPPQNPLVKPPQNYVSMSDFVSPSNPKNLVKCVGPVSLVGPLENMGLLHGPYVYKTKRTESTPDTPCTYETDQKQLAMWIEAQMKRQFNNTYHSQHLKARQRYSQ